MQRHQQEKPSAGRRLPVSGKTFPDRFRYGLVLTIMIGITGSCSKTPPENAILGNIKQIQTALEEKNNSAVRQHLSAQFHGEGSRGTVLDKQNSRQYLAGVFLRYNNINIMVSHTRISIAEYDPYRAESQSTVALTGAEGMIPESARVYQVYGIWALEEGEWRLVELSWE